jgi:uncharacterized protein
MGILRRVRGRLGGPGARLLLAAILAPLLAVAGEAAGEAAWPPGEEVAQRINARDEGQASVRRVTMELIDRRGGVRVREALFFRRFFEDGKRTVIFYESPSSVRGTAFLTWDYAEADREDAQWLYLPALRRSRRISASDRGDYFLGTDLTYEDVKKETKVALEDYTWRTVGEEEVDGHRCLVVEAVPVSEAISRELGYSRVEFFVDAEIWIVRRAEYHDRADRHLKTSWVKEIRQVDGIWTPHRIEVANHRTGHRTIFTISDVDYGRELSEDLFTEAALRRGPP